MPNVLDTTGVTISKSGRARDRGQHEVDKGQYDNGFWLKRFPAPVVCIGEYGFGKN